MKRNWTTDELLEQFTILPVEFRLFENKRVDFNKLGFICLYKYFQIEARFPIYKYDIPRSVVSFLGKQFNVTADRFSKYDINSRSTERHKAEIREIFGFKKSSNDDVDVIPEWLCKNTTCYQNIAVREAAYKRLRDLKIEPPTPERMDRIVSSAVSAFEKRLFKSINNSIPSESRSLIDDLIVELEQKENGKDQNDITFSFLRSDPGRICLQSTFNELKKLRIIKALKIPEGIFTEIPPHALKKYKQRVSSELLGEVRRHPDDVKYSLLSIFFWMRQREVTDHLVELLIAIIHKIDSKAVKKVERETLKDMKKVNGKYNILKNIAELSLENPEGIIKDVIYPNFDEQLLKDLIKDLGRNSIAFQSKVYKFMKNSYSRHYRRMLPGLLEMFEFRSNNDTHKPVLEAIKVVKQFMNQSTKLISINEGIPVTGVIKSKRKNAVIQKDDSGNEFIEKVNYEICVLQSLREKLRCKEIWVIGADKYRNPEEDLPDDFEAKRSEYYEALKQPSDVDEFIGKLQADMKSALFELNNTIPANPKVKILNHKGGRIKVTPADPQNTPLNISALKSEIMKRWPMVNLLDILKETDFLTDFTDHFKSAGVRENLARETIRKRILLTLFGLGTNTGLKRIAKASNEPESFDELRYIKRKFINKDNLKNAIVTVVNGILDKRLDTVWGEGTCCASDSKKFGAWDQNLMTEWHIRYRGRGVMIYWHVEKNSACIYSQLKSCSSSEVAAMIEGVLKHCTDMNIDRNYVDTHGQSEVAFAFSYLLNFSLMPRFKGINKQKLYLPENGIKEKLGNIESVLTRQINWDLIREQYDQMIKYATALKLGTAETEAIMKRFTRNNLQHPTYKAFKELGKVIKTIFLCEYLMSEDLRIEINEGLNVVENWNSANNFIFYGKSGEIQSNNLEDQELSVLALHLLQNCLVYINTLMIQGILSGNEWQDRMQIEDYRALTPLIYQHVNPYGKFELDMDERLPLELNLQAS